MTRAVTAALQAELSKTVTRLGYLARITLSVVAGATRSSQVLQWSNLGDVTYAGTLWVGVDLDVQNLKFDANQDPTCSIKVQNLDNQLSAFMLTVDMTDATVELYQFAPAALANGDAVQLALMVVDDCTIDLDYIQMKLVPAAGAYAWSPRRRVDSAYGFGYALPAGSILPWGSETFVLADEQTN